MLVTLKEILKIAEDRSIAVGAFNTPNMESLLAIIGAAEELQVPVIIQAAQCHESLIPISVIGRACQLKCVSFLFPLVFEGCSVDCTD